MESQPNNRYNDLRDEVTRRGGKMVLLTRHLSKLGANVWLVEAESKIGLFPEEKPHRVTQFEQLYEPVEEYLVQDLISRVNESLEYSGLNDPDHIDYLDGQGPEADLALGLLDFVSELLDVCKKHETKTHTVRRLKPDAYQTLLNWLENHP